MLKNLILVLFLITILDPYENIDYEETNEYDLTERLQYQIKTYKPSDIVKSSEVDFSDTEIDRFINKANLILNSYPPFVY